MYGGIWNFQEKVCNGTRNMWLEFEGDLDPYL